jgi:branched-subunit amino acid aminotransferase/4-amino-4-deoxychorismate lyase
MIWVGGRVVSEESLAIGPADRVLEHGLGLFETLRTWNGYPTLLARHLDRLRRSAEALQIPLHSTSLPDARAVAELLRESRVGRDARIRITATGGVSAAGGSTVWMRCDPLPPEATSNGAVLVPSPWPIVYDDPLARHKSLNYWSRRLAFEDARRRGADEALFSTPEGRIWEGSRSNLFLVRDETLWTPGLEGPIVPGIMRGLVLERAASLGLSLREGDLWGHDLDEAEEVFLTNAVRGIIPVARALGRGFEAPGPWTRRLRDALVEGLQHEGVRP